MLEFELTKFHRKTVTEAGYEVVFASPKGGKAPLDPSSVEAFKEDAEAQKFLNDAEIMKQIDNTVKLDDVKVSDFVAYFAVGGHGPVFDLTDNATNQKLITEFYESKKPTASVCHGSTVFLNIKDSNGERFVKGKKVTCFSDEEEEMAGLTKVSFLCVSFSDLPPFFQVSDFVSSTRFRKFPSSLRRNFVPLVPTSSSLASLGAKRSSSTRRTARYSLPGVTLLPPRLSVPPSSRLSRLASEYYLPFRI
jgi:putative intracellular protease/amidase